MNTSKIREIMALWRCRLHKPDWWRLYLESKSHDKWTSEQIMEFNWKKRIETLRFAYEHSPFYHELYKRAGLEPNDVKTENDWACVPIVTRDDLRHNFETMRVADFRSRQFHMFTTGGSTGNPSKVLKDDAFSAKMLNWRASGWAGIPLGQNSATIMRLHPHTWIQDIRHWLIWFPSKDILIDASNMNDQTISDFIDTWRRVRPVTVSAYAGGIHQLALYILEHSIEVPAPMGIFTTSAPCTAIQRNDIQKAFHAPVYDSYVCTEAHPMGAQCKCQAESGNRAMHIHADYRHLEFVGEDAKPLPVGQVGDILITDCMDRVFPIVRYRLGDRGRALPGHCQCGLPYPLMDAVQGRLADYITTETGRLSGEGWTMLFEKYADAVHGFQIHQHADKTVTMKVVLNREYLDAEKEVSIVAAGMQKQLGNVPLTVEYVKEIPHDRGKIRYIISDYKG